MLSMNREVQEKADKFDFFVVPLELKNYGILEPEKAMEIFNIGYNETVKQLKDKTIREKLNLPFTS